MALYCLQCGGFKFQHKRVEIPGTWSGRCEKCYLTNFFDDETHEMFGYLKRFSYDDKQYVFYSFKPKDVSVLSQVFDGINQKVLDQFPKYTPIEVARQSNLVEILKYALEQEKLLALPEIKYEQ